MQRTIARHVVVVVVVVLAWWFVRRLDLPALEVELENAAWWPLVLAAALHFVALWNKAACWRIMLAPRHDVATPRLFRYTVAAFAASAITPARAGEALRLWKLRQHDGVPLADSAATAVAEKLLDGVAMFIVVAPIPWLLPGLPRWVPLTEIAGIAAVLLVLGVFAIAAARAPNSDRGWARFFVGMHVLRSPRRVAGALAQLLSAWLIDIVMVVLVLHAVDISVPPATALLVLLTVNIALVIPAMPAQAGVHEAGAVVALMLVHVPAERALGFALLYHAIQIVPLLAIALATAAITAGRGVRDRSRL